MTDMIERVARAIHDNPPSETRVFEAEGIVVVRDYSVTARAVLKAMREPDNSMEAIGKIWGGACSEHVWRKMIDAALAPETIERSER